MGSLARSGLGGCYHCPARERRKTKTALPLPSGVKAVWDPAKAYRETTPTRERPLHQRAVGAGKPAADNAERVPTAAWGYYKVPACWPGTQDYMQSDYQTLYRRPKLEEHEA